MNPPDTLHETGREAFVRVWDILIRSGDDPADSLDTIERYAHACDAEATARQAWELDGCPMHALGSTGALVAHPIAKAVRDAEAHSAALAKSLGLTPEARSTMGRSRGGNKMGGTQAPDRKGLRVA